MTDISIHYHQTQRRVPRQTIVKIVREILRREKTASLRQIDYIFISDAMMRSLNRQFLRKQTTTDVLAFDVSDRNDRLSEVEIYINLDQAAKQAKEYRITYTEETLRLVIHGLLHFLGYDDHSEKEQKQMMRRGEDYLKQFYKKK